MPSNNVIQLDSNLSIYTAPTDGYLACRVADAPVGQASWVWIGAVLCNSLSRCGDNNAAGLTISVPVSAREIVRIQSYNCSVQNLFFVHTKSSLS